MQGYGQYCPLAKGAEVFAERWTPLILRELLRGSSSFNDLHRGVPRMSRSLLASRLRKLELCGVLIRRDTRRGREYRLTEGGRALGPVVTQLGTWGQRWYRSHFRAEELDVGVLMWDMRCTVDPLRFPKARTVVQFTFVGAKPGEREWWLVNEDGEVDLCPVDPQLGVDLLVTTDLRTMTRVWMGEESVEFARRTRHLELAGPRELKQRFAAWLHRSPYAAIADADRHRRPLPRQVSSHRGWTGRRDAGLEAARAGQAGGNAPR
jgi:DNA-binding HxlR family transcriptional regulator